MAKTLFTVYRTTNLVNGRTYVGLHETTDIRDSYLGSGKALLGAIEKYGRENFAKEILFVFDNRAEMIAKERELVDEKDPNTYNIRPGGAQTPPKSRGSTKGLACPPEKKAKISAAHSGKTIPKWVGEKISASHKERFKDPVERAKNSHAAKVQWTDPDRRAKNIADAKARLATPAARRRLSVNMTDYHTKRRFWEQQPEATGSFHFVHKGDLGEDFLTMGRI